MFERQSREKSHEPCSTRPSSRPMKTYPSCPAANSPRSSPAPTRPPSSPRTSFSLVAFATSIHGVAHFIAVKRFLASVEKCGLELVEITPRDVGQYLDELRKENTSVATRKQHLATAAAFFRWHGDPACHAPEPGAFHSRRALSSGRRQNSGVTVQGARALLVRSAA